MTDTRPPVPPWACPLSLQLLLPPLSRQNHLVCDQNGWAVHPLSLPGPGNFQTQGTRSPVGQEGQATKRGNRYSPEWQKGYETCQE